MATVVCVYEVVVKCHSDIYEKYLNQIKTYVSNMTERPGFHRGQVTQLEADDSKI